MKKVVRMKDIAQRLNVSTVTVSKALAGRKGVSEEMRQVIIKTAKEMGYKAPAAREEKTKVSYTLGILMAHRFFDKFDSFYGNLQMLLSNEASNMSCFTTMEVITDEMEANNVLPEIIRNEKVDGYLVLGMLSADYLEFLKEESGLASVYVDFVIPINGRDSVISDSFYGAYQLTNYLYNRGHRRIAYVGTLLSTGSITDRYLGYQKSMMEHGIHVPQEWVIDDRDMESGLMDTERFYQIPEPLPTAFVCNCDLTASYLERKLRGMGLKCPEDVSIVGYDNLSYPAISDMQFTSIEVDIKEMAKKAVHNLIHKLNREYYRKGTTIVVGRLVERNSVRVIDADD